MPFLLRNATLVGHVSFPCFTQEAFSEVVFINIVNLQNFTASCYDQYLFWDHHNISERLRTVIRSKLWRAEYIQH